MVFPRFVSLAIYCIICLLLPLFALFDYGSIFPGQLFSTRSTRFCPLLLDFFGLSIARGQFFAVLPCENPPSFLFDDNNLPFFGHSLRSFDA